MITDFVNFCRFTRNLCETTCTSYRHCFQLFSDFCVSRSLSLEDVQQKDVIDFMTEKRRQGVSASSINQYIVAVSAFYDWAVRFRGFRRNPAAGVQKMKTEKSLPVCVPSHLMKLILDKMPENTFKELRNKVVVLLGYHCGLRRAEMLALVDADLDFHAGVIRVYGKGRKVRLVPMSVQLASLMQLYMSSRPASHFGYDRVLVTSANEPLNYDQIAYVVKSALRPFLPAALCHCHILRHSFATTCMNAGVSIESIASLMGHESVETTMRYLTISSERVRAQIQGVF